ncbi:MAG: MarR family transcriptional regulator [Micrococcales bacterium]|nr:MarR family transcriptional regulator [Micrococcales bacterium]
METDSVGRVLREWAAVRPDLDVSAVGVIARMARIRAIVEAQQAQLFGTAGITPADFPVLVSLRRRQRPFRMTHTQLANELGLTPGTVTSRVDHLVALGVVHREIDLDDARIRWVVLTDAGLGLVEDLIPRHLEVEEDLLAGISDSRRQRLANDLAALLADLENRYR